MLRSWALQSSNPTDPTTLPPDHGIAILEYVHVYSEYNIAAPQQAVQVVDVCGDTGGGSGHCKFVARGPSTQSH